MTLLMSSGISAAFAGGPRLDWPEDSSDVGKACWVEGYDTGFAGKYDKGRADECADENDEYNRSWKYIRRNSEQFIYSITNFSKRKC